MKQDVVLFSDFPITEMHDEETEQAIAELQTIILRVFQIRIGPVFCAADTDQYEYGNWIDYHPLTTVSDGTPIESEISGNGED